jgi:hypothetical protein
MATTFEILFEQTSKHESKRVAEFIKLIEQKKVTSREEKLVRLVSYAVLTERFPEFEEWRSQQEQSEERWIKTGEAFEKFLSEK